MIKPHKGRSKSILMAALAAVFCGSIVHTSVAEATLITNGDFEADAAGWTLNGNVAVVGPAGSPLWFGGGNAADNGTRIVAFNSGNQEPNGWLSQTFSTVASTQYDVQFDYGVTGVFLTDFQDIIASILGSDGVTELTSLTANGVNPPSALNTFKFSFIADGAQATIRFDDVLTNISFNRDGILDNVNVSVSVPEPSTLMLMGIGLVGFGWMGRRRKQL